MPQFSSFTQGSTQHPHFPAGSYCCRYMELTTRCLKWLNQKYSTPLNLASESFGKMSPQCPRWKRSDCRTDQDLWMFRILDPKYFWKCNGHHFTCFLLIFLIDFRGLVSCAWILMSSGKANPKTSKNGFLLGQVPSHWFYNLGSTEHRLPLKRNVVQVD